jgi:hypothetical protein
MHARDAMLPAEEWRLLNQELARRCDVILRMPGPSPDADAVAADARNRGVPVFDDYKALLAFAREGSD